MAKKDEVVAEEVAVEVSWEAPPSVRGGRSTSKAHAQIAEQLKSKPGEWAKVSSGAKNDGLASSIRRSTGANFRDGKYEARSVKQENGSFDIFARFIEDRTE